MLPSVTKIVPRSKSLFNLWNNFYSSTTYNTDVVIIGGAVIGSSAAYFLSKNPNLKVTVIEKDPSYRSCATTRSAASIRHQFSTKENIEISQFGTEFLRNVKNHLKIENKTEEEEIIDVQFKEHGYLFLATEKGKKILEENTKLQQRLGSRISLLSKQQLNERFPWIKNEDIEAASFGEEGEGWFDPSLFMNYLRKKSISQNTTWIKGNVVGLGLNDSGNAVNEVVYEKIGEEKGVLQKISCKYVINAAGTSGRKIASWIGADIPVFPRKRCIFYFECEDKSIKRCPLVVDPSGLYWRGEKDDFITGISPTNDPDMALDDFEVDYELFEDIIWPLLANRVPSFEKIRIIHAWAGHYDFNTFDHNVIVGPHHLVSNFYFANGFSGHGLQQSPAIGRALSELIIDGKFTSLDLSKFSFSRILENKPIIELNVV